MPQTAGSGAREKESLSANGPSRALSDAAEVLNLFPSTIDVLCLERQADFVDVI